MFTIKSHKLFQNGEQVPYSLTPNRSGTLKPEGIILHDTAGRLSGNDSLSWLTNSAAKASAHFLVFRDGKVHQLAPLNTKTWHAGKSSYNGRKHVNNFAIGIEIVNPGRLDPVGGGKYKAWYKTIYDATDHTIVEKSTPEHGFGGWMDYTEEQVSAVTDICNALVSKYNLQWISTHWKISPGRKVDTNPLFPLAHVRSKVFGRNDGDGDHVADGSAGLVIANANHRKWPSYFDNVITEIPRHTTVEIIRSGEFENEGRMERWYLVSHGGHDGWVHGSLIETIG